MRSRSEAQAECRGVHQALATSCASDVVEVGGARHGKAGIVGCVNVGGPLCVEFVRFASLGAVAAGGWEAVEGAGTREALLVGMG